MTWDSALPDSIEVTATVEHEGEPLVLTDFVWITEGAQDNILISIAKAVDPVTEGQLANNPLETVIEDPVRLFAARRDVIEREEDPKVKKYQLFYWNYDYATHPRLIPENPNIPEDEKLKRRSIIMRTAPILSRRVLERAAITQNGTTPQPGQLTPLPDVSELDYLSKLQLGIMREYLSDGYHGIDYGSSDGGSAAYLAQLAHRRRRKVRTRDTSGGRIRAANTTTKQE